MLWASAFTPGTRCADMRWAGSRGSAARYVVFGGIHATPLSARRFSIWATPMPWSKGDGDLAWARRSAISPRSSRREIYEGGRVEPEQFKAARWDLLPPDSYMWASVQTVRGCAKHCSFCSVWRTDGQKPRQRASDVVIEEIVALRPPGFSFHRAGRRQLLSRHAHRFAARRAARQPAKARATGSHPRGAL